MQTKSRTTAKGNIKPSELHQIAFNIKPKTARIKTIHEITSDENGLSNATNEAMKNDNLLPNWTLTLKYCQISNN